jgi:hypothetical protein
VWRACRSCVRFPLGRDWHQVTALDQSLGNPHRERDQVWPVLIFDVRQAGVSRLSELRPPDKKDEAWRFTDLTRFYSRRYSPAAPADLTPELKEEVLAKLVRDDDDDHHHHDHEYDDEDKEDVAWRFTDLTRFYSRRYAPAAPADLTPELQGGGPRQAGQ